MFARAGADIVAPSDMMDGRIGAIKDELRRLHLHNKVSTEYVVQYTTVITGQVLLVYRSYDYFIAK